MKSEFGSFHQHHTWTNQHFQEKSAVQVFNELRYISNNFFFILQLPALFKISIIMTKKYLKFLPKQSRNRQLYQPQCWSQLQAISISSLNTLKQLVDLEVQLGLLDVLSKSVIPWHSFGGNTNHAAVLYFFVLHFCLALISQVIFCRGSASDSIWIPSVPKNTL